jgi:hypothetical protein
MKNLQVEEVYYNAPVYVLNGGVKHEVRVKGISPYGIEIGWGDSKVFKEGEFFAIPIDSAYLDEIMFENGEEIGDHYYFTYNEYGKNWQIYDRNNYFVTTVKWVHEIEQLFKLLVGSSVIKVEEYSPYNNY